MQTIDEYLTQDLLEIPASKITDSMIEDYITFLRNDHEEYREIMEGIDYTDFGDSLFPYSADHVVPQIASVKRQIIEAFKLDINDRVEMIKLDIEEDEEIRQEFEATEARAINNE